FSLLKQSPLGAVRLKPLVDLFAGMLSGDDIRSILGELQAVGYLLAGRSGEWRSGERLNKLVDLQAVENNPLSLFSNIQSDRGAIIKIRDYHTQEIVARVSQQWFDRDTLTLEGRTVHVEWGEGDTLWVSADHGADQANRPYFRSAQQILSYELAQCLPAQVGLSSTTAPLIPFEDGWLCFHWLGDIYGYALLDLIRYTLPAEKTAQPGLCLWLPEEPTRLPTWTLEQVSRYLNDHYRRYESLLALGAYHHLLPLKLRRRAVLEQFNVPRFLQALNLLHVERTPDSLQHDLEALLN
ncbi:MAG: hypothetical protein K8I60_16010, partial [Anaerolineae bacterium]|nr:hypothetical protein [Anaerolineae bacterium]